MTRARTLTLKCQFTDDERNERLAQLIIASTPFDALRNYLYINPKGHPIADILAEGRKYCRMLLFGDHVIALIVFTCGHDIKGFFKKRCVTQSWPSRGGDLWGTFCCLSGTIGPPEMKIDS